METLKIRRLNVCLLVLALAAIHGTALACPNCKEALANDPAAAGLVRGYFYSILFMLSMPVLIFSGLSSYFYWEICRGRARQQIENGAAVEVITDSE